MIHLITYIDNCCEKEAHVFIDNVYQGNNKNSIEQTENTYTVNLKMQRIPADRTEQILMEMGIQF